jgi:hypothetical protein
MLVVNSVGVDQGGGVDCHHSTCIQFVKNQLQGLSLANFKLTMPSSRVMRPCPKRFVVHRYVSIDNGRDDRRHFHCRGEIRVGRRAEKSTSKDTGFFRRLRGAGVDYQVL